MDGSRNRGATQGDQVRFIPAKGAMGNRPEVVRGQAFQGDWNQGQGGRFHDQPGGWYRYDRRPGQEKEASRERAIVLSEGNKANPNPDVKCFRCLGMGHYHVNCTREPMCYKCKEKGHMAIDCKASDKKLKMFGFGIPGQGFYALNFPESKIKTHQSTRLLTILEGEASERK